ncbi:BID domain-containing T4SS effector [Bartonella sp. CB178]|uniref:BID domain-containing T4SS effector n=1 Tax=Bartonella sp. CB178 TaxID=3112255 RepID=UPI00300E3BAE
MKKAHSHEPVYADLAFQAGFYVSSSNVLKNKRDIRNAKELEEQCQRSVAAGLSDLRDNPITGTVNSKYLKEVHHRLYKDVFEWAGHIRSEEFTFSDGVKASMPRTKKGAMGDELFAKGGEVTGNLRSLDQSLSDCNYLKGLSREEFSDQAWQVYILLEQTRPFVHGNEETSKEFLRHLAEEAGHKLDFSLVSQERLDLASEEAIKNNNVTNISNLFADISNPEKAITLKEATDYLRELGIKSDPEFADPGKSYAGTYVGATGNSAVVRVGGTFTIIPKDNLNPEEVKSYKFGDHVNINVLSDKDLGMCLVPEEDLGALTQNQLSEKISANPSVRVLEANVMGLSQVVYGNPEAMSEKLREISTNPEVGEQLAQQIMASPKIMGNLAGKSTMGIKNEERKLAEESVPHLAEVLCKYAKVAAGVKEEALNAHYIEQERRGQEVRMPSGALQDVLRLPTRARLEKLESSPSLQKELDGLVKQLNGRLSPEDHKAIKNNDHGKLAEQLGTSVLKAKKIAEICQKSEEAKHDLNCAGLYAKVNKPVQSKSMAMAS